MMKKLLLLLVMLCVTMGAATDSAPLKPQQHKAMHWIVTTDGENHAGCTANAISEHVLITAEHCNIDVAHGDSTIWIDRDRKEIKAGTAPTYRITEKYFDDADHALLVIPGASFKDTIPYNFRPVTFGEHVYFWGNPAGVRDVYREGRAVGMVPPSFLNLEDQSKGPIILYQMPVVGGDSGSTVFSDNGDAVGIVTYSVFGGLFMGAYPVRFTPAQIEAAEGLRGASCAAVAHTQQVEDDNGKVHTENYNRFECKP